MLKLWNITEIGNTLTASSIVNIVVCGKIWSSLMFIKIMSQFDFRF